MRIIAGELKGRRLAAPPGNDVRPTSDSLRETLFNVLGDSVRGARVLDAFAGTGALGLEAISRGAAQVVFIESHRHAAALVHENVALCGAADRCAIIRDTAERALEDAIVGDPFDLVMLDPPYDYQPLAAALGAAAQHLAADGWLILEHATRRALPAIDGATAVRTIRSGDSALTIYGATG